jgi:FkbM family methyltransferase
LGNLRLNFSRVSNKTIFGKALRFPLRVLPTDARVVILQGKLRGRRWIAGSTEHGCWLGSYEYEKRKIFERTIERGTVVFDVGAHVGFYTLLASVLVGPRGKVIAFEPLPRNLGYLRSHLSINRVANVSVVEAAVGDLSGAVLFDEGLGPSMGHIAREGSLRVQAVTLDEMVMTGKIPPPAYIKVDVEGAEARLLAGARKVLSAYHPVVFLATHSEELYRECTLLLRSLNYELQPIAAAGPKQRDELVAKATC